MENVPVHLLKGLLYLLPTDLETKLNDRVVGAFYKNGEWSKECLHRGVFFDLSQVRWVEIGVASQLVLFIEHALKSGIKIYIALPCISLIEENPNRNPQKDSQKFLNQRTKAHAFLINIDFHIAVMCEHLSLENTVLLSETYEPPIYDMDTYDFEEFKQKSGVCKVPINSSSITSYKSKTIFPLTWCDSTQDFSSNLAQKSLFTKILTESKGNNLINNLDLKDIENTILLELLKNVDEHAGNETKYALFSMAISETEEIIKTHKKFKKTHQYEDDYIKLVHKQNVPFIIEIFFGDSGKGILNYRLKDAYQRQINPKIYNDFNCLNWAFDKWSTSKLTKSEGKTRGTKGLYRIHRLIDKYDGLVMVRNAKVHGGFITKEDNISEWVDNKNSSNRDYQTTYNFNKGTFVQFKLCPYTHPFEYRFKFSNGDTNNNWFYFPYRIEVSDDCRADDEKFNFIVTDFQAKMKQLCETQKSIVLILTVKKSSIYNFKNSNIDKLKQLFEELLYSIALIRHPTKVLLYFVYELGTETIREIINSVTLRRNSEPNPENVSDPYMVIAKNNSVFWCGGNKNLNKILEELTFAQTEFFDKKIQLISSTTYNSLQNYEKRAIELNLKHERNFINIDKEDLVFNISMNTYEKQRLQVFFITEFTKPSNIKTLSPKLKFVDNWINIKNDILKEREDLYSFLLYLLIHLYPEDNGDSRNNRRFIESKIKSNTKILIDNSIQKNLAIELAKLLGLKYPEECVKNLQTDVDYQIPRRTNIFNEGESVIIFTTVISSSETIRRLVKQVRRDRANDIGIICFANLRKHNVNKMETWGKHTLIYSLYQKYPIKNNNEHNDSNIELKKSLKESYDKMKSILEDYQLESPTIIEPNYEEHLKFNSHTSRKSISEYIREEKTNIGDRLKSHIANNKALHYGHFGDLNHRHFTFYLNKNNIINDDRIKKAFLEKINSWIQHKKLNDESCTLLLPKTEKTSGESLLGIAEFLNNTLDEISGIEFLTNSQDRLSYENIIYLDFGALTGKTINALLSKTDAKVKNIIFCILFSQLLEQDDIFYKSISTICHDKLGKNNSTDVQIYFLQELPLGFYNSTNCPICEHLKALEKYKSNDVYLTKFATDRKDRVQIKSKNNVTDIPTDFYFTNHGASQKDYELSSHIIMEMFNLSYTLEKALSSTFHRIKIYTFIYEIYSKLDELLKKPESKLYALLYFLSNEIYWMQREPIVFRDIRKMLAEISLKISTYSFTELEKEFEENYKVETSASTTMENLVTRYKFAAITVLRSANKHLFCESISKILKSSARVQGNFSDNLIQITFYYINTILLNKHNSSSEYFNNIETQLKKCSDLFKGKNTGINFSYNILRVNNERQKVLYIHKNDLKPIQLIKELKKAIGRLTTQYNNHPPYISPFEQLSLEEYSSKSILIHLNKSASPALTNAIYQSLKDAIDYWRIVKNYFHEIEVLTLELMDSDFGLSEFCKTKNIKFNIYFCLTNRFEEIKRLLSCFNKDSNSFNSRTYAEYREQCKFIYDGIICHKSIRDSDSNDSLLLNLVNEFPCNLKEILTTKKSTLDRNNIQIEIKKGSKTNIDLFIPKITIKEFFQHLIQNINKRRTKKTITINIKTWKKDKYLIIHLEYSGTNLRDKNDCNEEGGLAQNNEEFNKFGGKLTFGNNEQKNIFELHLRLQLY